MEDFHGTIHVEDRMKGDHSKGARFVVMLPAVENGFTICGGFLMPRNDTEEFDYNIRRFTHVIGLHSELLEGLRDEVKSIIDKEKKTPEDFDRYIDLMDRIIEESAKLQRSSKELSEYIHDQRLKRESEKKQQKPL